MMGKEIIYQLLPRLWGPGREDRIPGGDLSRNGCGTFADIDGATLAYLAGLGVRWIWLTGVIRHATRCSTNGCTPSSAMWVKGEAGSPYAITDYFDVNPYLARDPDRRMEEFQALVGRIHAAGMRVMVDFVPNHVARDYGRFARREDDLGSGDDPTVHWRAENDFFYYPGQDLQLPVSVDDGYRERPAKASGNCYSPAPGVNDWYDTVKLNYCPYHTHTWDKMERILLFWAGLGVDGFRCDMVELVPVEFFRWVIPHVKERFPDRVFLAEVYDKSAYDRYLQEAGFDWLYDKSGLYDALWDIVRYHTGDSGAAPEPWQSARRITANWQQMGDRQARLLHFLENHDEPRFASAFFGREAGHVFAALHVSLLLNTGPFLLYAGQEAGEEGMDREGFSGQDGRTSIFDWWSPDAIRRLWRHIHGEAEALSPDRLALLARYRRLLRLAATDPAISHGGMYDLAWCNEDAPGFNPDVHAAFLRHSEDHTLLIISNFSSREARMEIRIPPHAFAWMERAGTPGFNPRTPVRVCVPAMDGVILELGADGPEMR